MAQVYNAIQYGGKNLNAIARAIGLGEGPGIERLSETLQPVFDVWSLPEFAFLRGERLCARFRSVAAVAAEFPAVALINAVGNQILAVVESIGFNPTAAQQDADLEIASEATILATLGTSLKGNSRDLRFAVDSSICDTVIGTDPAATIGSDLERVRAGVQGSTYFTHVPIVLHPGFGLVVVVQTVNVAGLVNFRWRERSLLPGELRSL